MSRKTKDPSYHTFHNREGQTIQLRGDLTMEDMIRMGYTDIGLAKPETPLKPNEWRCDSIPGIEEFRCVSCNKLIERPHYCEDCSV